MSIAAVVHLLQTLVTPASFQTYAAVPRPSFSQYAAHFPRRPKSKPFATRRNDAWVYEPSQQQAANSNCSADAVAHRKSDAPGARFETVTSSDLISSQEQMATNSRQIENATVPVSVHPFAANEEQAPLPQREHEGSISTAVPGTPQINDEASIYAHAHSSPLQCEETADSSDCSQALEGDPELQSSTIWETFNSRLSQRHTQRTLWKNQRRKQQGEQAKYEATEFEMVLQKLRKLGDGSVTGRRNEADTPLDPLEDDPETQHHCEHRRKVAFKCRERTGKHRVNYGEFRGTPNCRSKPPQP